MTRPLLPRPSLWRRGLATVAVAALPLAVAGCSDQPDAVDAPVAEEDADDLGSEEEANQGEDAVDLEADPDIVQIDPEVVDEQVEEDLVGDQ